MSEYDPGHFRNEFESELGQQLWAFLNEHDNMIRMETATYLRRPAAEAMEIPLLKHFDNDDIMQNRTKQMIGHMIRQIMEKHGFNFDQASVRITNNVLFSSAARYRKTDWL